jgi:dTDP-glucose 4,6-dehydratase
MRLLITGGAGFVGSHLCDHYLSEGHSVVVMDNLITGNLDNIAHHFGNDRFQFIKQDVSNYIHVDGPIDAVLHFASPASPNDYLEHPIPTLKVGSLGTFHTLGLAKAKGARYLLASTSEVYGDPLVNPQPETYWGNVNPIGPRGVYDEAKRFAEAMTLAYQRYHGMQTRIVRIFNTYGPRMRLHDGRVVPNFIYQALTNQPLTVYMDGQQTRSFQYVSDLVDGISKLLLSDEKLPVNIGNPVEMTILQFAEAVLAAVPESRSEIIFVQPDDERIADDPKVRRPDITKARAALNWEPGVNLDQGLAQTVAYFRPRL